MSTCYTPVSNSYLDGPKYALGDELQERSFWKGLKFQMEGIRQGLFSSRLRQFLELGLLLKLLLNTRQLLIFHQSLIRIQSSFGC